MNANTTTKQNKIKFLAPWNVKIGHKISLIGPNGNEYVGKVIKITKRRGQFEIAGNIWQFHTDCQMFNFVQCFGPHRYNGRKYPAEKIAVTIEA